MKLHRVLGLLAGLFVCAVPQLVHAASKLYCSGGSYFWGTMALQISSLTVPRDLPNGTTLYAQAFSQAGGVTIECALGSYAFGTQFSTLTDVLGGVNTTFFAGKVYATGVPGIGVVWSAEGGGYMDSNNETKSTGTTCTFNTGSTCRASLVLANSHSVRLVKTGPVGTGVIRASDLGRVNYSAQYRADYYDPSDKIPVGSIGLKGSIQVVGKTCTTPDVKVPLARHKVSSLKGINTFAPTVSFEIRLTDCPGFPGRIDDSSSKSPISSQDGAIRAPVYLPPNVNLQIAGATVLNAGNGVLGLTTEKGAATGVGVQLLDASGSPFALSKNVSVPNLDANTTSVSIKLGARYIQTAAKVVPGGANAVATYTLNYQ
ncbi:hypothetical protein BZG29_13570 [Janthinobacterium sp. LM6]|uniref:fimbrial protein n=1 Tax=Janthinobacterium sp. LM6 TaxID=1938606 RepID=UPI000983A693|nr:fimbrial protein [Janthinobacterium sp. LM6]AQR69259.1 hypothetical protein BZG29_13570 [Janthinobacterium sp. LM6]